MQNLLRIRENAKSDKRTQVAFLAECASRAKLAQMMVGVKIGQTHPLRFGHRAKMRMRFPREFPGLPREALDRRAKFLHVRVKLCGMRAADLLVNLRRGLESLRPLNGRP